ncbi:MAG: hypothetical protein RMM58_11875 [Chloroflexota bacterium]|nr:hypothetical protein [Dehalococcoidia bacterium]MDW8254564.1 hypothetical protein [Chloroflexota bacterium]
MSDLRAEFEAAVRYSYGSFLQFDPEAIERGDADDGAVWHGWFLDPVRGKAGRADDIAAAKRRGPLRLDLEPPVVTFHGNVAIARYYLDFAFAPPNATSGRVWVTPVFERDPSAPAGWRRLHRHEGMVPAGRPPLPD